MITWTLQFVMSRCDRESWASRSKPCTHLTRQARKDPEPDFLTSSTSVNPRTKWTLKNPGLKTRPSSLPRHRPKPCPNLVDSLKAFLNGLNKLIICFECELIPFCSMNLTVQPFWTDNVSILN